MGFFSRLANKVSSIVSSVAEKISDAAYALKSAASQAVDWAKEKLSNMKYDSGSTQSRVDVENVLADFKSDLNKEAKKAEKKSISEAMNHFDTFAEDLEGYFPEFAELVRIRKMESQKELEGIIIDYVQVHVSENDPDFQKVLELQPGSGKQWELDQYMTEIVSDAESEFRRKLKKKIKKLNKELNERLDEKLNSEEEMLSSIAKKYEDLERQIQDESLDLEKLEKEFAPSIEVAFCIQQLLEQEVGDK